MGSQINAINAIVTEMKKNAPGEKIHGDDKRNYLISLMGSLLALLAEDAEERDKKMSEQTDKMIHCTKAVVRLTYALLFVGIIQIFMMIMTIILAVRAN